MHLSHVDGKRFRPSIKQLEKKEAVVCRDLIRVINDEDVVRPHAHHSGQSVLSQKRAQVVVSDPAVLPAAFGEVVEEHVQDFVTYVIIGAVEEELQKTGEKTNATQVHTKRPRRTADVSKINSRHFHSRIL